MIRSNTLGLWPLRSWLRYRTKRKLIANQIEMLPEAYVGSIGQGNFLQVGLDLVDLLVSHAGLQPRHRVLDLGCGLSRVAMPLQGYLDSTGSYEGLDVVPAMIEWNHLNVAAHDSRFQYRHVDLQNSAYNEIGEMKAEQFVFPFDDGEFDLAFASSLFTHLQEETVENYLTQLARVLKPGGQLMTTWFILNPDSLEGVAKGTCSPSFGFVCDHGRLADPENPDEAIAFDEAWLRQLFDSRPLTLEKPLYGSWTGTRTSKNFQDVLIASKV